MRAGRGDPPSEARRLAGRGFGGTRRVPLSLSDFLFAGTPLQSFPAPFPSMGRLASFGGQGAHLLSELRIIRGSHLLQWLQTMPYSSTDRALLSASFCKGLRLCPTFVMIDRSLNCFSIHPLRSALRKEFRSLRAATRGRCPLETCKPFEKRLERKFLVFEPRNSDNLISDFCFL